MSAKEDSLKNVKWEELKQRGSEHYKVGGIEPIDLYRSSGMMKHFALCSIIKYAFRSQHADEKTFLLNMEKIVHYAELLKVM